MKLASQLSKVTDTKPIGSPKSDRSFESNYYKEYEEETPKEDFEAWTKEFAKEKSKVSGEDQPKAYYRLAQIYTSEKDYHGAAAFY